LLNGNEFRVKVKTLPKFGKFIYPLDNSKIENNGNAVSFEAVDGDYGLIMSRSESFADTVFLSCNFKLKKHPWDFYSSSF